MTRSVASLCVVWLSVQAVPARANAADAPKYAEHQDLSYYVDGRGRAAPIRGPADWGIRRGHVLSHMQSVMGPLPKPATPPLLDMRVTARAEVNGVRRWEITYHTDSRERVVPAYLFLPQSGQRLPAVLCLHQTTGIGKEEPAGLSGNPNLHYALHLAERGYVTLAPDYPSFGDYEYDFETDDYVSGTMKAIYDNVRAVDLLHSLDQVDPERIGVIGHSLGGHNAMFTAAFEPRIKAIVSNCGFTRFHKYYEGKLGGWTSARYMPRIASEHGNDPDRVPFDFTEIVASFAPRPFLASSPVGDGNFEVSGVKDVIAAAKPVYGLYGAEDKLQANYPDCGHDFPADVRETAYRFLDRQLKTNE
jgi:pimeloyl-ACP methyl ester carboxylesterase